MKHLWPILALLAPLLLGVSARAEDPEGEVLDEVLLSDDDQNKTLAERIPSVTRRSFVKRGRLEIYPAIGTTFNDPFYDNLMVGGGLAYHVLEWLSVGISGEYFVSLQNPVEVSGGGGLAPADLNRPEYSARLELMWAPFYGKLSLLAEHVVHFDTFISVGGGIVGPTATDPTGVGTVAVGQHFFFNEWMGLRLEVRSQMFMLDRNPRAEVNSTLQNLISATIGLSFWVPPRFEREAL